MIFLVGDGVAVTILVGDGERVGVGVAVGVGAFETFATVGFTDVIGGEM